MKKRTTGILIASLAMVATIAAGCGQNNPTDDNSSGGGTSQVTPTSEGTSASSNISVAIDDPERTSVFGGETIRLSTQVKPTGTKLNWSSSDTSVATVTNGVVKTKAVTEDKTVTITASAKTDSSKTASITLTVKYCPINLADSRGSIDASDYDGSGIYCEPGDTALLFDGVHGQKYYVEAEICYTETISGELFPKFGIMNGTVPTMWFELNNPDSTNNFFCVDAQISGEKAGWTTMCYVPANETRNDWNWNASVNFQSKIRCKADGDTYFKMGMLRNGVDYYMYLANMAGKMYMAKHVTDHEMEGLDTYAWIGGWGSGYYVRGFKALVGDAVDTMFTAPTELDVVTDTQYLYMKDAHKDTYQIIVDKDSTVFDTTKLSFTSSSESVVTVDASGLVVPQALGEADVTVKYDGGLDKTVHFVVTDDINYKVDIDGKMDDKIWSETVKKNAVYIGEKDYNTTFYATRNSRGVYIYADQYVKTHLNAGSGWFEQDNIEVRVRPSNDIGPCESYQICLGSDGFTTADNAFAKLGTEIEDGYYHNIYEMFVAYNNKNTNASSTDKLVFKAGTALANGWKNISYWTDQTYSEKTMFVITENGLVRYDGQTELSCANGSHAFSTNMQVVRDATCVKDGLKAHVCAYCHAHDEGEVIPSAGQHFTADLSGARVLSNSSCCIHGHAEAVCDVCGQTYDAELPFDYSNHTHVEGVKWCYEGNPEISSDVHATTGGWSTDTVTLISGMTGNFELEVKWHQNSTATGTNEQWKTVLPILFDTNNKANRGVIRLDWWGWTDGAFATYSGDCDKSPISFVRGENPGWWDNFNGDNGYRTNGDWTMTMKRTGNSITVQLSAVANGIQSPVWTCGFSDLLVNDLTLAFGAEYASFNVTSLKYVINQAD